MIVKDQYNNLKKEPAMANDMAEDARERKTFVGKVKEVAIGTSLLVGVIEGDLR